MLVQVGILNGEIPILVPEQEIVCDKCLNLNGKDCSASVLTKKSPCSSFRPKNDYEALRNAGLERFLPPSQRGKRSFT